MQDFKTIREACWAGYKQVGMKKKGNKQVPNCVPEEEQHEDAPANAVAHGGVDMNPNGMHPLSKSHKKYKDENDAEAALRKLITKKFSTTVTENKETNSTMMNSILDQLDRLDVIVDNHSYGKSEPEFVEKEDKKSILEKANLKEYGTGPLGSIGLGGGSYGAMHPIASLGDTPPKGRHRTMRSVGLVSQKDPRQGIDQSKKDFNLKVVHREKKNKNKD